MWGNECPGEGDNPADHYLVERIADQPAQVRLWQSFPTGLKMLGKT